MAGAGAALARVSGAELGALTACGAGAGGAVVAATDGSGVAGAVTGSDMDAAGAGAVSGADAVESVISIGAGCEAAEDAGAAACVALATTTGWGAGATVFFAGAGGALATVVAAAGGAAGAVVAALAVFTFSEFEDAELTGLDFAGAAEATLFEAGGFVGLTFGTTVWWARAATDAEPTSLGFSSGSGGSADFGKALSAT